MALDSVYTAALMEHNSHPEYKYLLEDYTCESRDTNSSCGDAITLRVRLSDDGSVIEEIAFLGHGCTVSLASADMLAELVSGLSIVEAKRLIELFNLMLQGEELDEDEIEDLDEACEFQSISNTPDRIACAQLAWHILERMLA